MLTDSAIRAAKSKTGQTVKLSDGGGLQLWVQPSGSKLWNLAYRFAGRQRKLAIGSYPGIGLKEARAKREEAKKLLTSGFDPSQQKRLGKLRSRRDFLLIRKSPRRDLSQMSTKPRNLKVSGLEHPRLLQFCAAKRPNSIRRVLSG